MKKTLADKVTGADNRPAWEFESRGLRQHALVVERQRRCHGGAAVAEFCRLGLIMRRPLP